MEEFASVDATGIIFLKGGTTCGILSSCLRKGTTVKKYGKRGSPIRRRPVKRGTTVMFMKVLAINIKRFIQHEFEKTKEVLGSLDPKPLLTALACFSLSSSA